jgi:GWxTD domain-containing protein
MPTRTTIIFSFLFGASRLLAQNGQGMMLHLDAAAFKYDESKSYVECYYSLPRAALSYERTDGQFSGSALFQLVIQNANPEKSPLSKVWRVPVQMTDTAGIAEKMLIGKLGFSLEPGKYTVALTGYDERNPAKRDSVSLLYEVRGLSARSPHFSDIELSSSVRKVAPDSGNIFYKNTLEVIPNPPLLFGKSLPSLMYYLELYNADLDRYILKTDVITSYGKTAISRSQRKNGSSSARVEVGSLDLSALPTGSYTFIASYCDTTGKVAASQSKQFFVYNPDVEMDVAAARQVASTIAMEFAAMPEDELEEHFSMAKYIAGSDERKLWSALQGAEARKKFLTKFWSDRDPDAATPRNELYEVFMQRVQNANEQFRTAYNKGWKTDRGRVYIVYGPPDMVQRNNGDAETKPHETWTYDNIPGQGTADFVFMDPGGFNNYQLIHSTHRNEMSNPDWERQLKTR